MNIHFDYSGQTLGKYQLIRKLGNGGFGAVYQVYDTILKVEKALKLLQLDNPSRAQKVFLEASLPYKCQHHNIIKINGGELFPLTQNGKIREIIFAIDMELANGSSVEGLLKKQFIPISQTLSIIKDILFAIEHSHNQGIIHRDIKPANILIDNGIPKLSDFGLASALGEFINPPQWYMTHCAPEAYTSNIATVQTDIYALGMTLYRMINNITDWQSFMNMNYPNWDDLKQLIINGTFINELKYEPYVPEKLKKIIKKACAFNPSNRFQNACEMRNAIIKLHIENDWTFIADGNWITRNISSKNKEIYIEPTKKCFRVIVEQNGRKISKECKEFLLHEEAMEYVYSYVKDSTIK